MSIQLYNTLSKKLETFKPLSNDIVTMYSCGPTVYDFLHIGNWSAFIYWDVLARTLKGAGYKVDWIMNITDVGHLTSDADEGEDKLEKGARREGKSAWDVAAFYTGDFMDGLKKLNISIPGSHLPRATDHIKEQINLIMKLESGGYTYKTDDGIYFDSSKLSDYGKLAKLDTKGLKAGARVDVGQKKNITDFALWKFNSKNQKRDMEWESPWGKGFPGWHLECSAMAMKYLGDTIDIHCGGVDHITIHHTNEIAQSEAATKKQFVRYWLHCNHMQVNGKKIAKSTGNGITLSDLEDKGFSAQDLRIFVLQSHYRTQSNFTWALLESAHNRLNSYGELAALQWQPIKDKPDTVKPVTLRRSYETILDRLQNDLSTPLALAELDTTADLSKAKLLSAADINEFKSYLKKVDAVLGLQLSNEPNINDSQKQLIQKREQARQASDFKTADGIRKQLHDKGLGLRDTNHGPIWYRL